MSKSAKVWGWWPAVVAFLCLGLSIGLTGLSASSGMVRSRSPIRTKVDIGTGKDRSAGEYQLSKAVVLEGLSVGVSSVHLPPDYLPVVCNSSAHEPVTDVRTKCQNLSLVTLVKVLLPSLHIKIGLFV